MLIFFFKHSIARHCEGGKYRLSCFSLSFLYLCKTKRQHCRQFQFCQVREDLWHYFTHTFDCLPRIYYDIVLNIAKTKEKCISNQYFYLHFIHVEYYMFQSLNNCINISVIACFSFYLNDGGTENIIFYVYSQL